MNFYWFPWLAGMGVPFVIKFANFMLNATPGQYSFSMNAARFLFGDVKTSTTTFISMTFELVMGAWYIDRMPLPYMEVVLPEHWALAFFLAAILEVIAPICVRGIISWTVDKINKLRGVQAAQKPTTED